MATAKRSTTKKAAPAKKAAPKKEAAPKVALTFTRNGDEIARNSLSYVAYLERTDVASLRAELKRRKVNPDGAFKVTLKSGTELVATVAKGRKAA